MYEPFEAVALAFEVPSKLLMVVGAVLLLINLAVAAIRRRPSEYLLIVLLLAAGATLSLDSVATLSMRRHAEDWFASKCAAPRAWGWAYEGWYEQASACSRTALLYGALPLLIALAGAFLLRPPRGRLVLGTSALAVTALISTIALSVMRKADPNP